MVEKFKAGDEEGADYTFFGTIIFALAVYVFFGAPAAAVAAAIASGGALYA